MLLSRRQLFLTAAAGLLPRLAPAGQTPMIVRSPQPADLEMPLDGFTDFITPLDRFFVRCHTLTPRVDLGAWSLKVDGLVDRPLALSLDDLKQLPRVELVSVLECAGNGRSFYQPRVPGTQWAYGSVGNGRWAGVRLRDVLQKAGVRDSAKTVLCDAADVPLGKMPKFQRTLTTAKAMHPDTLLAYEMNGQPLPVEHGFPLRVIAPGWAGDSWVKWLQHLEVLDHEFSGFWMAIGYRHPSHHVEPGSVVDPKDMVPVTDLNIKSVIATQRANPGLVHLQGAAWSNSSPVTQVEISTDAGRTWNAAELTGERTQYGWRLWNYDWKAPAGQYTVISRATNAAGQTQPLAQEWNPSGYLWNVAQPMPLTVGSQQPNGYKAACLSCHDDHMVQQQHLTHAQWDRELKKMEGWGAPVSPQDREAILDYLEHLKTPSGT